MELRRRIRRDLFDDFNAGILLFEIRNRLVPKLWRVRLGDDNAKQCCLRAG